MSDKKVITPEAMISYPHIFSPQAPMSQGDEPKYGAAFVFEEGTDLTELKRAVVAAAKERWGEKAIDMMRKGQLRNPLRTDVEGKGYPEGSVFINAKSKRQPGVVSTIPDPNNDGKPMRVTDPAEIYPGAIVKASLVAFAYDYQGNKGVSFGLNNIQKIRDGDRLDGKVAAVDEFDADQDAVADLSDLTDEGLEGTEAPAGNADLAELFG